MKAEWRLESLMNEHKFFLGDKLVIHIFKANGLWQGHVLGLAKTFSDKSLDNVIKKAERGAKDCGWF